MDNQKFREAVDAEVTELQASGAWRNATPSTGAEHSLPSFPRFDGADPLQYPEFWRGVLDALDSRGVNQFFVLQSRFADCCDRFTDADKQKLNSCLRGLMSSLSGAAYTTARNPEEQNLFGVLHALRYRYDDSTMMLMPVYPPALPMEYFSDL
jgi:hypothetical protein